MKELVTYERHPDGFGVIMLNRMEKRNAISLDMAETMLEKLKSAITDELKFLVITGGSGPMFCAGGDLRDLHGELTTEEAASRLKPMLEVLQKIVAFPVPVIAKLNGDALGGGCELATACDIRIAKANTKFGFIQTKIGILPGWGGGALLYKKVDPSFALEWITTGQVLSASTLKEKGWVHQVIDEEDWEEEDYFAPYKERSLEQMRLLKAQFKANIQAEELPLRMLEESKSSAALWQTEAHRKALEKFSQRKN